MRFGVVAFLSLFLLSGCAENRNFRCEELNNEWNNIMVLLSDLPCAFCDMTAEEGARWARYTKQKDAIVEQLFALDNCTPFEK